MSKRRIDSIMSKTELSRSEKSKRKKEAEIAAKRNKKTKGAVQSVASTGIAVASGATVAAAGGSVTTVLSAVAVAAPPFSTAAAVVAGLGVVASLGLKQAGEKRKKWLAKDEGLLRKLISKYKKKNQSWRKKEMKKLLKKYDKHLTNGNKKTLAPFDGNKKRKKEINWRSGKAKLEMKMRAVYAAQYGSKKSKKSVISSERASAERAVIQRLKIKQAESIDPRTSQLKLIKPGIIQMTPKQAAADIMQLQVPDTSIIKLAKLSNENPALLNKVDNISESIVNSQKQAISISKMPEQEKDKTPILIGLASAGIGLTILTIALVKK